MRGDWGDGLTLERPSRFRELRDQSLAHVVRKVVVGKGRGCLPVPPWRFFFPEVVVVQSQHRRPRQAALRQLHALPVEVLGDVLLVHPVRHGRVLAQQYEAAAVQELVLEAPLAARPIRAPGVSHCDVLRADGPILKDLLQLPPRLTGVRLVPRK